jgi:hypothetical protein
MNKPNWRRGSLKPIASAMLVVATRFTYKKLWHLPGVFLNGSKLVRNWPQVEGAMGVSVAADVLKRSTYTISVWRNELDLRRWLGSPHHADLMRRYRSRLESSDMAKWQVDSFDLLAAWQESQQRLINGAPDEGLQKLARDN